MSSIDRDLQDLRSRVAGAAGPGLAGDSYYLAAAELLELAQIALEAGHAERALLAPDLTADEIKLRGELILARERLARSGPDFAARIRRAV